jgi:hypothetical protein
LKERIKISPMVWELDEAVVAILKPDFRGVAVRLCSIKSTPWTVKQRFRIHVSCPPSPRPTWKVPFRCPGLMCFQVNPTTKACLGEYGGCRPSRSVLGLREFQIGTPITCHTGPLAFGKGWEDPLHGIKSIFGVCERSLTELFNVEHDSRRIT